MKRFHEQRGFTAAELIVTTAIVALATVGIATFQQDSYEFRRLFQDSFNLVDESRKILRPIANEIRSASPSSIGNYALQEVSDNQFTFFSDADGDGLKERLRYFLDGTDLKRGKLIPTGDPLVYNTGNEVVTTLITDVQNGATSVFEYYDTNYNGQTAPLTQPVNIPDVRLVKITVIIDADPVELPLAATITTQVTLRNIKDNL